MLSVLCFAIPLHLYIIDICIVIMMNLIPVQHPCNSKVSKLYSPIFCQKDVLYGYYKKQVYKAIHEKQKMHYDRSCGTQIPVILCPCGGFFDHVHASMPSKSVQTNRGSTQAKTNII